jgi:hypothetical protein
MCTVQWEEYSDGGARRLRGHADRIVAVVECGGRVCSGSFDWSILVWRKTGDAEESLSGGWCRWGPRPKDSILSMAVWEDRLISWHASGQLMVWNVAPGAYGAVCSA